MLLPFGCQHVPAAAAVFLAAYHLTSLSSPSRLTNLALAELLPNRPRADKTIQSQGNTVNTSHQNLDREVMQVVRLSSQLLCLFDQACMQVLHGRMDCRCRTGTVCY